MTGSTRDAHWPRWAQHQVTASGGASSGLLPSVQMLVPDRVPAAELERAREDDAVVPHEGVAVVDEPTAMLCIRMTREAHT